MKQQPLRAKPTVAITRLALGEARVTGAFRIEGAPAGRILVYLLLDGKPASSGFARRIRDPLPGERSHEFTISVPRLLVFGDTARLAVHVAGHDFPVSPGPVDAHAIGYVGYVKSAGGGRITGWVVNLGKPAEPVALHLLRGGRVIAQTHADQPADDARIYGLATHGGGFTFKIPPWRPGRPMPDYAVVLAETGTHLANSPLRGGARITGFFDGLQGRLAGGWVVDLDDSSKPVDIEVVCDGAVIRTETPVRHFRPDVETAGIADGHCGFRIDLGDSYRSLLGREIAVRVRGTDIVLDGSPRLVQENPNISKFLGRTARVRGPLLERLRRKLNDRLRGHALSIVMPVHNTRQDMLVEALDSVRAQWCDHWELICVDDGSTQPHVAQILKAYARADGRIRVLTTPQNVGIARATNFGLRAARFAYVSFMDHDDRLEPDAVSALLRAAVKTGADFLYSDEVLTHEDTATVMEVSARPSFSWDYYLSHPYFVHMLCMRRDIAHRVGGWDESMAISADVDFVLRCIEASRVIAHVPAVLYRWRTHAGSAGHAMQARVMEATKAALARHLARCGLAATVSDGQSFNQFRVTWPDDDGRVLIVIPTKNKGDLLNACIRSIERTARAADYRIVIIDHESDEPETRTLLKQLARKHTVMPYTGSFNFARMNNVAVRRHRAGAKYVLFLNNDIEAIESGWLERMRSLAHRPDVGAVGALLLYGDRRVQHAGVIVGFNNVAGHVGQFQDGFAGDGALRNPGYNGMLSTVRDFSAVTAACMMMRREVFERLGGFDESFPIGFNDTDLCLRVVKSGLKVLYDGFTVLHHHESATRATTKQISHPADDKRLRERWRSYFEEGDPFYSPLLDQAQRDHALREQPCRTSAAPRVTRLDFAAAPETAGPSTAAAGRRKLRPHEKPKEKKRGRKK